MRPYAIFSGLWEKNSNVLIEFAKNNPNHFFILSGEISNEVSMRLAEHECQAISLVSLLEENDKALLAEKRVDFVACIKEITQKQLRGSAVQRFDKNHINDAIDAAIDKDSNILLIISLLLKKIENIFDVRLLLLNEDVTGLGRFLVNWARRKKIPSLLVSHGCFLSTAYTVHNQLFADYAAVFGERTTEAYLDAGIDPARLKITGNPAWDDYARLIPEQWQRRMVVAEKLELDRDLPFVLFATTWNANLTASQELNLYEDTLKSVLLASKRLWDKGIGFYLIIKDREPNQKIAEEILSRLIKELDLAIYQLRIRHVYDAISSLIVSADLVISVDSNVSIEGMIANRAVINLLTISGIRVGPSFSGDDGIVEVEGYELPDAMLGLLAISKEKNNKFFSTQTIKRYAANLGFSAQLVAQLMAKIIQKSMIKTEEKTPVWRKHLSVSAVDVSDFYHGVGRDELISALICPVGFLPKNVLDVGCGAGANALLFRKKFPGIKLYGIELNPNAAQVARGSLDYVFNGYAEKFDFQSAQISPKTLDLVLLADVLEHLYNPWDFLLKLKPYLSTACRLLISIPNVQNIHLINQLIKGDFSYQEAGLLDITHIRFFTLKTIKAMLFELGFVVEAVRAVCTPGYEGLLEQKKNGKHLDIKLDNITLSDVSAGDIESLTAFQYYITVSVAQQRQAQHHSVTEKSNVSSESMPSITVQESAKIYQDWLDNRVPSITYIQTITERMVSQWRDYPDFSLYIFAQHHNDELAKTLNSIATQLYKRLRVIICSNEPLVSINYYSLDPQQVDFLVLGVDSQQAQARFNAHLQQSSSAWVAFFSAGTILQAYSLLYVADYINRFPNGKLIYTDSDKVFNDTRFDPFFKPEFNLDYLRSFDYMAESLFFELGSVNHIGGVNFISGAEHYDLVLRFFDYFGEGAIVHLAEMLVSLPSDEIPSSVKENSMLFVLQQHLDRQKITANVFAGYLPKTLRVEYLHQSQPLVSIVIPNKNKLEFLEPCIRSLMEKTDYPAFEIVIVDNQTDDPDVLQYYAELSALNNVIICRYDLPFNFSAQCNLGVDVARGEYILLLNNDTEAIQTVWLSRLMAHAQRPDVGIVAPRLLYPETNKIQHAGVLLGLPALLSPAEHPFLGSDIDTPGYMNRVQVDQNYSAVTAACLLVRKSIYQAVGGMDDTNLKVLFNDVDLCLKVGEAGYRIVYTPYAMMTHHGNTSLNTAMADMPKILEANIRSTREREFMIEKWLNKLAHDPAYNRHLSLLSINYGIEQHLLTNWDTHFKDRPRIIGFPLLGGSGDYRMVQPLHGLRDSGAVYGEYVRLSDGLIRMPTIPELARLSPDTILVQNVLSDAQIAHLPYYKRFKSEILIVNMLDDLLTGIPEKSSVYKNFKRNFRDTKPRIRKSLKYCDRLVVSTEPLLDFCAGMIDDIRLIPNALPREIWGDLKSLRGQGKKPRIGWVGAQQHQGDLEMIVEVVKELADEVEWVFMGMWLPEFEPYVTETHGWVSFAEYPEKLASLNLDLAIAPLEVNAFNEAKSNLRLLEYGVLGLPVVCTDIFPYQTNNAPVKRVPNTKEAWVTAIRERVYAPATAEAEGNALQAWVKQHYLLEHHLDAWYRAFVR